MNDGEAGMVHVGDSGSVAGGATADGAGRAGEAVRAEDAVRAEGAVQAEDAVQVALREENARVGYMYARLDAERDAAERALRQGPLSGGGAGLQAQLEKSVATDEAARTLSRLLGVEHGLCFGRVDHRPDRPGEPGDTFYIGRIGLRDEDREPLLIDSHVV
ncbi:hypothetical protein AB0J52_14890 [Spirillospora sp. NPDC049652]